MVLGELELAVLGALERIVAAQGRYDEGALLFGEIREEFARLSGGYVYEILRRLSRYGLVRIEKGRGYAYGEGDGRYCSYRITPKGLRELIRNLSRKADWAERGGPLKEARDLCGRILQILEKAWMGEDLQAARVLRKLARILTKENEETEAEKASARAKAIEAMRSRVVRMPHDLKEALLKFCSSNKCSPNIVVAGALRIYLQKPLLQFCSWNKRSPDEVLAEALRIYLARENETAMKAFRETSRGVRPDLKLIKRNRHT